VAIIIILVFGGYKKMPDNFKRYAVIVGVSDYKSDEQITKLPFAKNDAVRLYEDLIKYGGFKEDQTYLLINDVGRNDVISPTRGEVFKRIQYVCDSASDNDMIFFFFAGHGIEISKNPYLLTSDTMMDVLQQTAIKITELNELMEKSKAKCIIRIFDSCRSPFGESRGITERMTIGLQDAMLKVGSGWASLSSCSSGEVAHESGELNHGIFSYYLCEGIEGKAANEKGEITFERLVDYVKTSVGNWIDQQSQKQTPHLQSDLSGTLILSLVTPTIKPIPSDITNPLDVLKYGVEQHLAKTTQETRNLSLTSANEMKEVSDLTFQCLNNIFKGFSHPALTIEISEARRIQYGTMIWLQFTKDIKENKLVEEYKPEATSIGISFTSPEIILPRTSLEIAVVRFSIFYWIWYVHICNKEQLSGAFKFDPEMTKGFFTLKPKAARDGRKIENVIKELLKRASEDILKWAEQLKAYAESRVKPLEGLSDIIE
jgi:hypothetical protein